MLTGKPVKSTDLTDLLQMIAKLCAFHDDTSRMDLAEANRQFIHGPLTAFIARKHEAPVGYLVLCPHWRPAETGDLLEIAHLFVEQAERGRGIGRALIAQAQRFARHNKACRLVIGTALTNPTAATIYRQMGFDEIVQAAGPRFRVDFA